MIIVFFWRCYWAQLLTRNRLLPMTKVGTEGWDGDRILTLGIWRTNCLPMIFHDQYYWDGWGCVWLGNQTGQTGGVGLCQNRNNHGKKILKLRPRMIIVGMMGLWYCQAGMVAGHGGELGTWMEVVEGCCLPKDSTCHPNYQHNSNNENSIYIYTYIFPIISQWVHYSSTIQINITNIQERQHHSDSKT